MPGRRLRPLLLAALAALLLAAGLAPASPSEPADETAEAGTIVTVLQPGWNMVGWIGPETATSELFEEIPTLQRVSAWDAEAQQYQRATRASSEELRTLTPGMGLWLRLGGNDAVRWTRPAAPGGLVLQLRRGLNFVGVVAGGAVNRFNAAASGAWRWDPARQQYQPYRFGDPVLSAGDALWIQVSAPVIWWQPGAAAPPFVFLGDVPAEIQSDILAEYSNVRRFFAEHFAVATRGRLYHIAADLDAVRAVHAPVVDRDPRPAICGWPSGEIHILLVKCAELTYFSSDYVTDLLLDIPGKGLGARWEPGLDPRGPGWLIEGMLLYAHTSYREAEGRLPVQQRENLHTISRGIALPLRHFEVTGNRDEVTTDSERALGFFAVEWLAERVGNPAVFDYLRLMRASGDWRAPFATAFGIGVEDFYKQFEAYRAEAFPPLPHLTDDLDGPVLLFIGDVPAHTAAEIRSEFENVRQFFADRFEAEATEFTLYVARTVESAARALPNVGHIYCSSVQDGRAIVTLDRCHSPFTLDYLYIGAIVLELAPLESLRVPAGFSFSTSSSRAPAWASEGLVKYAAAAYRAAAGRLDIAEYRGREVNVARVTRESLRDQASYSGPPPSLSYLAVDWLVERAGEPAVFEYYRVLPSATSAAAAFESAFGLTIEEFYEQFEAYRETLRQ